MTSTSPKSLNELMKLESLEGKTSTEIESIWLEFHEHEAYRVASVMSRSEWQRFSTNAKQSPLFVLPITKPGGGYLSMLSQTQLPLILLTTVDEFRTQLTSAPAHLTLTIYSELESKDLILLRGDIINDKTISKPEARLLTELLRAFYSSDADYKAPSIGPHAFNHSPGSFSFEDLLSKLKITGLSSNR